MQQGVPQAQLNLGIKLTERNTARACGNIFLDEEAARALGIALPHKQLMSLARLYAVV